MTQNIAAQKVEKKPIGKYKIIYLSEDLVKSMSKEDVKTYCDLTKRVLRKRVLISSIGMLTVVLFAPYAFKTMRLWQGYQILSGTKFKSSFKMGTVLAAFPWMLLVGSLANIGINKEKTHAARIAIPKV
jgi:hypothetical protein